jgi:hypothetical protein
VQTVAAGTFFTPSLIKEVMITLEFRELVEVSTPKGDGVVWYMMDYGPSSDTLYTIVIKETGECWQMTHKDFRVKPNITMGIGGSYTKPVAVLNKINGHKQAVGG